MDICCTFILWPAVFIVMTDLLIDFLVFVISGLIANVPLRVYFVCYLCSRQCITYCTVFIK